MGQIGVTCDVVCRTIRIIDYWTNGAINLGKWLVTPLMCGGGGNYKYSSSKWHLLSLAQLCPWGRPRNPFWITMANILGPTSYLTQARIMSPGCDIAGPTNAWNGSDPGDKVVCKNQYRKRWPCLLHRKKINTKNIGWRSLFQFS
jgi:hypothetical protein